MFHNKIISYQQVSLCTQYYSYILPVKTLNGLMPFGFTSKNPQLRSATTWWFYQSKSASSSMLVELFLYESITDELNVDGCNTDSLSLSLCPLRRWLSIETNRCAVSGFIVPLLCSMQLYKSGRSIVETWPQSVHVNCIWEYPFKNSINSKPHIRVWWNL